MRHVLTNWPSKLRRRGGLAVILSSVLGAIALFAVWQLVLHVPDPHEADREGLLRWLVLRQIALQPADIQQALVDRLQEELASGMEVGDAGSRLTASQQRRLQENAQHLLHVWFVMRSQEYARLPAARRLPFLQRQIAALLEWTEAQKQIDASGTEGAAEGEAGLAAFFARVERWIAEAAPAEQTVMRQAVSDGIVAWLATGDLKELPAASRRELALQIAEALDQAAGGDPIGLELNEVQQQRLAQNGELLLEAWFLLQADALAQLPQDQQKPFVAAQIDRVLDWGVLGILAGGAQDKPLAWATGVVRAIGMTQQWVERAENEQQRARLQQLLVQVQQQLLQQRLFSN